MTIARRLLVDLNVTRFYHCISSCVRQAFLCGEGCEHRKKWLEDQLKKLAKSFAISVCGYSILDNHLHTLCRLDPEEAEAWSAEEVILRWIAVFPPRTLNFDDPRAVRVWVEKECQNKEKVNKYRERLQNLGWFMKALKEPLARMANKEDECKGAFWSARYRSIAILDEEALLATCAYIDLNPVAAGIAAVPETSEYTSIKQRVDHAFAVGAMNRVRQASGKSVAGTAIEGDFEQSHWLCPLQDRSSKGASRKGMLPGLTLSHYLELVDWTSRLWRDGKARVSSTVADIMTRLGTSADAWGARLKQMLGQKHMMGNYFATQRQKLREVAQQRGSHHVDNILGRLATA